MTVGTADGLGMQAAQAQVAFRVPCSLGEGSLWDASEKRLYWVDIDQHKVFAYNPENRSNLAYDVKESVGTVVLTRNAKLLLAMRSGFKVLDPDTGVLSALSDPEFDKPGNRFNDGKCDPSGRFWAGTMVENGPSGGGALYCLHPDLRVEKKLSGVTISNGLVWTRDQARFFYIDTPTHEIRGYDFDADTAEISRPRVVAEIPKSLGAPDGMAIDEEDQLWVALFGGHKVVRIDPATGGIRFEVTVAARNVTSCAFGGPQLDELYITTARIGVDAQGLEALPDSGSLFCAKLPFRGVPSVRFARDL